jgi:mRNA interferase RelE/StbE
MKYRVEYAPHARRDLENLDIKTARRIVRKINQYIESGQPLKFAKPLKGDLSGAYRFRVGDYRVIFDVSKRGKVSILFVLRIGNRNKIYGFDI